MLSVQTILVCWGIFGGSPSWKIGIWAERGPGRDSAALRRFADSLVSDFSRRVEGGARLTRFGLVGAGRLPLSGGDPRFHPDLRDSLVDAAWGIPVSDSLGSATVRMAERAWLSARGCPDERNFAVGWDLFRIPDDPYNHPDTNFWRRDAQNFVRFPGWRELPDTGFDPLCRRALRLDPPRGRLRLFSVDSVRNRLDQLLPSRLEVSVSDQGRPAAGAVLELWRARPDARRVFGARLEGRPDTLVSDTSGRFPVPDGRAWFTGAGGRLVFGTQGSNALSYWRVRFRRKTVEGWMDATDLSRLADDSGAVRLSWELPGGSSNSWKEATEKWPHGWLAAEADSTGTLTLGVSVSEDADYVLRILDTRGHEFLHAQPVRLTRGVHERVLRPNLTEGLWDIRMDTPSERWQVRVQQPARKPTSGR